MKFQKRQFPPRAHKSGSALAVALIWLSSGEVANAFPTIGIGDFTGTFDEHVRLVQSAKGFLVADASGPAGEPLPLKVTLPNAPTDSYSFLMFRNLPPEFKLSAGFGTKEYWAVSLPDVSELRIIPPSGFSGSFIMETLFVRSTGSDPQRAISNVIFVPPKPSEPPEVAAAEPQSLSSKLDALGSPFSGNGVDDLTGTLPRSTEPKAPDVFRDTSLIPETKPSSEPLVRKKPAFDEGPISPAEMSQTDRALFARGDKLLQQGDVASARLIYRKLALKNIAESALAIAGTYDPDFLEALEVKGLRADVEEAKYWYERASKLGSTAAAQRLKILSTRSN